MITKTISLLKNDSAVEVFDLPFRAYTLNVRPRFSADKTDETRLLKYDNGKLYVLFTANWVNQQDWSVGTYSIMDNGELVAQGEIVIRHTIVADTYSSTNYSVPPVTINMTSPDNIDGVNDLSALFELTQI